MTTTSIILRGIIFFGILAATYGFFNGFLKSVGRTSKTKPAPDKPISNWVYFKGNTNSLYYAYNHKEMVLITVALGTMSSVSHLVGETVLKHHALSAYLAKKSFYKQIRPEEFVSVFNQFSDKVDFSL